MLTEIHSLRSKICSMLLIAVGACSAPNVFAKKVPAKIRICVTGETDSSSRPKARVILSGGSGDVVFPEADASQDCTAKDVKLDDSKQYILKVDADGYQSPPPITLTAGNIDSKGLIERVINLKALASPPSSSPNPSPSPARSPTPEKGLSDLFNDYLPEHWALDLLGVTIIVVGLWLGRRLWRAGYRVKIDRKVQIPKGAKSSTTRILEGLDTLRADLVKMLGEIRDELRRTKESAKEGAPQVSPSPSVTEFSKDPLPAQDAEQPPPSTNSGQALAHSSYLDLLAGKRVSPAPTYLKAEGRSEPSNIFGSRITYLEESSQGAFLLFKDIFDSGVGWVYPDPRQTFQQDALASVFKDLGEAEFSNSKENIDPVRVIRADEGRWRVETR